MTVVLDLGGIRWGKLVVLLSIETFERFYIHRIRDLFFFLLLLSVIFLTHRSFFLFLNDGIAMVLIFPYLCSVESTSNGFHRVEFDRVLSVHI